MYMICYANEKGNTWEIVSGEDAMNIRVHELNELGFDSFVFSLDDEIK